jgi:predicted protein tyrosine phosphatase
MPRRPNIHRPDNCGEFYNFKNLMNYCNLIPTMKINTKVLINNKYNEGLKNKRVLCLNNSQPRPTMHVRVCVFQLYF